MAAPYWTQPLPAQYGWAPTDYAALTQYAAQQPTAAAGLSPLRVAPVVATYATLQQKQAAINGALPEDRAQYQDGVVVGSATRYYPAGLGGIGMVTSPLQNAAQASATGVNDWHTVGVLRQGGSVWIHDPAYTMDSQARLPMIPGTANVTRLLNSLSGTVTEVQVQGWGSAGQECMGRSAQWVDNVLGVPGATAPFGLGTFVAGQATPGWQVVSRY